MNQKHVHLKIWLLVFQVRSLYITELAGKYHKNGIKTIANNNYKGNRRNLTFDQEVELLLPFKEKTAKGQIVEISEIIRAYEQATSKSLEKKQWSNLLCACTSWVEKCHAAF